MPTLEEVAAHQRQLIGAGILDMLDKLDKSGLERPYVMLHDAMAFGPDTSTAGELAAVLQWAPHEVRTRADELCRYGFFETVSPSSDIAPATYKVIRNPDKDFNRVSAAYSMLISRLRYEKTLNEFNTAFPIKD